MQILQLRLKHSQLYIAQMVISILQQMLQWLSLFSKHSRSYEKYQRAYCYFEVMMTPSERSLETSASKLRRSTFYQCCSSNKG